MKSGLTWELPSWLAPYVTIKLKLAVLSSQGTGCWAGNASLRKGGSAETEGWIGKDEHSGQNEEAPRQQRECLKN